MRRCGIAQIKLKAIIHNAQEDGYSAQVPAIPGCATEGDTVEELLATQNEAVDGRRSVDVEPVSNEGRSSVLKIAI